MDIRQFLGDEQEQPLSRMVTDGGFCGIFRTIGCVGDSLSSGEFESHNEAGQTTYHDLFDYSWGQYLARMAGCKVYNFSRGGMTASEYCQGFAEAMGFWDPEKACQAYIIALAVNDLVNMRQPIGSLADVDPTDWRKNAPTYAGYYAQIIQRLKEISPHARFFLVTVPRDSYEANFVNEVEDAQAELMYAFAKYFTNTYVVDYRKYAPLCDAEFRRLFFMGGHMTPAGYILAARMMTSYIDYIIRHNLLDFHQVGLIGTPYYIPET